MRRKVFLILIIPFLICMHAMAMSERADNTTDKNIVYGFSPDRGRWNHYASDYEDTIYFYDIKSVLKNNNKIKVWIKFGEPVNDEKGTRYYKEASALKEIDCSARLIRTIEWNYLSMKEEYNQYTSPTKWENVEPETVEDALLEEVCTQPKQVKKR